MNISLGPLPSSFWCAALGCRLELLLIPDQRRFKSDRQYREAVQQVQRHLSSTLQLSLGKLQQEIELSLPSTKFPA